MDRRTAADDNRRHRDATSDHPPAQMAQKRKAGASAAGEGGGRGRGAGRDPPWLVRLPSQPSHGHRRAADYVGRHLAADGRADPGLLRLTQRLFWCTVQAPRVALLAAECEGGGSAHVQAVQS